MKTVLNAVASKSATAILLYALSFALPTAANAIPPTPPLPIAPNDKEQQHNVTVGETTLRIPEKYFAFPGRDGQARIITTEYSVHIDVGFPHPLPLITYTRPFKEKYAGSSIVPRVENQQWVLKAYRPFTERERQAEIEKAKQKQQERENALKELRARENARREAQGKENISSPLRPVALDPIPPGFLLDTLRNFWVRVEIFDKSEWKAFCRHRIDKGWQFSGKYFSCNENKSRIGQHITYHKKNDPAEKHSVDAPASPAPPPPPSPSPSPPPPSKNENNAQERIAHIVDDIYVIYETPIAEENPELFQKKVVELVKSFLATQ